MARKRATQSENRGKPRQSFKADGEAKWGYLDSTRNLGAQDFSGTTTRAEQQNKSRQTGRPPRYGQDHAPADIADQLCTATENGNPRDY